MHPLQKLKHVWVVSLLLYTLVTAGFQIPAYADLYAYFPALLEQDHDKMFQQQVECQQSDWSEFHFTEKHYFVLFFLSNSSKVQDRLSKQYDGDHAGCAPLQHYYLI